MTIILVSHPSARHCISDTRNCGYAHDQTFVCIRCEKKHCYCFGMADDMPALCDACWNDVDSSPWREQHA